MILWIKEFVKEPSSFNNGDPLKFTIFLGPAILITCPGREQNLATPLVI